MSTVLALNPLDLFKESTEVCLPFGMIGLRDLRRFRVSPLEGSWPFLAFQPMDDAAIQFLAIQPFTVLHDYSILISNQDAEALRITGADDCTVLNIVTVHTLEPQFVTVNLAGPILINNASLMAMQIIPENCAAFSTTHPLIDERGGQAIA